MLEQHCFESIFYSKRPLNLQGTRRDVLINPLIGQANEKVFSYLIAEEERPQEILLICCH